jgi:hypothetical protein
MTRPAWLVNAVLAVAAMLLVVSVSSRVGRADAAFGLSGVDAATRSSPLVPLIASAAAGPGAPLRVPLLRLAQYFDLTGDETARLFTLLNLAFAGLLAMGIGLLIDLSGGSAGLKTIVILNLFATAALARLSTYQPLQIELGACVFVTLAVCAVLHGVRGWITAATILAVLARETGLAAVLFGLALDRHRGIGYRRSAATYAPALFAFAAVQVWAYATAPDGVRLPHPELLAQPLLALSALVSASAVFGGVSLFLIARALWRRLPLANGGAWAVYAATMGAASLLPGMSLWAAVCGALPAVVVLFARAGVAAGWRVAFATGLATLCTQSTWAPLSDPQYLAWLEPWRPEVAALFASTPHAWAALCVRAAFAGWFVWWVGQDMRRGLHAALGLLAAGLLMTLQDVTGAIAVNNGYGYDGAYYVRMMQDGFEHGTPSTRLRPLVVWLVGALDRAFFHDPVAAFRAVNLACAALLAAITGDLCRRYGATWLAAGVLVANLFLCISTSKLFAFYPALIDLAALTVMTASVWAIVTGRRLLSAITVVLAALSREFAAVVALFGIVRDVRQRRHWLHVAATYVPGLAAVWWVRHFAAGYDDTASAGGPDILTVTGLANALAQNLQWWADPLYALFWLYFALTVFGGLSIAIVFSSAAWKAALRREPEWLAIVIPMVAVTAVGYLDMWRYLVFALPALAPFWAWYASSLPERQRTASFLAVSAATLLTQRPWQRLDGDSYFRDWFPYYLVVEDRASALVELAPAWQWHAAACGAAVLAVVVLSRLSADPANQS